MFDWALLRTPYRTARRRCASSSLSSQDVFPSWSWTVWVGEMNFNVANATDIMPLNTCLSQLEVIVAKKQEGRRIDRQISTKHEIRGKENHFGQYERHITFTRRERPHPTQISLDQESNIRQIPVPERFLKSEASLVPASNFLFQQAMPWFRRNDYEPYADPFATQLQDGVWIKPRGWVDHGECGFLYGVTALEIDNHDLASLQFMAMSVTDRIGDAYFPDRVMRYDPNAEYILESNPETVRFNMVKRRVPAIYVMLIVNKGDFYERVAIGHISEESWSKANPALEVVMLG